MRSHQLSAIALILCAGTASAQGLTGAIGLGMSTAPRYAGGDEYRTQVIPYIQLEYANKYVAGVVPSGAGLGVGIYVVRNSMFSVEVEAAYGESRGERYGSALAGMGDRSSEALFGTSTSITYGMLAATGNIVMSIDAGAYGTAELSARRPVASRWMVGVSGGATFATEEHMRSHFGITPSQALRRQALIDAADPRLSPGDGAAYAPSAGLKQTQAGASLMFAVSERRSVIVFSQFTRLSSEAAASTLVRDRDGTNLGLMMVFGL